MNSSRTLRPPCRPPSGFGPWTPPPRFAPPTPTQRNTDHAIPKARGGNNTPDNAQNTCRTCNLNKGTKTTEEYTGGKR